MNLILILLFFAIAAFAQQTSVAVLLSDGTALNSNELEALTDEMREAALKALPTHGCKNNIVFPKCGTIIYNPATHDCKGNTLFPVPLERCGGTEYYNPRIQECRFGAVFQK